MPPTVSVSEIQVYVTIIRDIVTCFAAGIAAYVGWRGLQSWQRQLIGKTEYELAGRLLRVVYQVREAVIQVRSPLSYYPEGEDIRKEVDQRPDLKLTNNQIVFQSRFRRVRQILVELEPLKLESEIIFGKEISIHINNLYKTIREFEIEIYENTLKYEERNLAPPEKLEVLKILYYDSSNENTLLPKGILESIDKIEDSLKKHLAIEKPNSLLSLPKLRN